MFLIPHSQYTIKTIKNKGRGVFATKDIPAGTIIGDYLGIVINEEDEEVFEKEHGLYLFTYTDDSSIAPLLDTEGVHLINHSCSSNTETFPYKGHILYFALRKIFKGEEITANYGITPPTRGEEVEYPCYCGGIFCHGTMHVSKEKSNRWERFKKGLVGKRYAKKEVSFGEMLPPLKEYPKSIDDYEVYDLSVHMKKPAIVLQLTSLPPIKKLRALLRENGQPLKLPKLNMVIIGIKDEFIVSKPCH